MSERCMHPMRFHKNRMTSLRKLRIDSDVVAPRPHETADVGEVFLCNTAGRCAQGRWRCVREPLGVARRAAIAVRDARFTCRLEEVSAAESNVESCRAMRSALPGCALRKVLGWDLGARAGGRE